MSHFAKLLLLLAVVVSPTATAGSWSATVPNDNEDTPKKADEPVEYGVDVSFPIHHRQPSDNYPWLPTPKEGMAIQPLGDRQTFYKNYIDGCTKAFGSKARRCETNENDRVAMSLRQPQSMQVRYSLSRVCQRLPHKVSQSECIEFHLTACFYQ
jgi:hypothetical protein